MLFKLCNSRIKRKRALLRHRWNLVVFYLINYKLVINVKREEGMRIPRELFLCLLSLGKLFSKLHNEPYFKRINATRKKRIKCRHCDVAAVVFVYLLLFHKKMNGIAKKLK